MNRRAFSISPLVVLLVAALVALVAWRAYVRIDHIPANYPGAAQLKSKTISNSVVTVLFIVALAGGVGAAAYFAAKKSDRAANAGIGVVLLLGVGVFAYQAYNYLANGRGATGSTPQVVSDQRSAAERLADSTQAAQQRMQANTDRMREEMSRMQERAREAATPMQAPPSTPSGPAATPPTPATPARPASPPPARPAAPAVDRTPNPAIEQTLDSLTKELDSQTEAYTAMVNRFMESVQRSPQRSMPVMDQRRADAKALKAAGKLLAERFRGLSEEAQKRLEDAGLSSHEATSERIRYEVKVRAMSRAMACGELDRLCDNVKEECDLLHQSYNNWKYDSKGALSSNDRMLEAKARSIRSQIESGLRRAEDTLDRIRGK